MSEWISCKVSLPRIFKLVYVHTNKEVFRARRSFFGDKWVLRSGLCQGIQHSDDWKELSKEEKA